MRRFLSGLWVVVLMLGAANMACAEVVGTFVNAAGGSLGNTVNAADDDDGNWYSYTNSGSDNYWCLRTNYPNNQGGDIFECSDLNQEDVPMVKTTIGGLTPGQSYAISVIYDGNSTDATWNLGAGLSSGSLTNYYYGDGVSQNTGIILEGTGSGETVYTMQADLGTAVASASGQISVYVDKITADWGRARYDGVAYQSVPEPSTMVLLFAGLFGLLAYAWRKRK